MAAGLQRIDHHFVGLPHKQPRQSGFSRRRGAGDELAVVADRVIGWQMIFLADEVIVQTVRRRGMHSPCTSINSYMIAYDHRYISVIKWVLEHNVLQIPP